MDPRRTEQVGPQMQFATPQPAGSQPHGKGPPDLAFMRGPVTSASPNAPAIIPLAPTDSQMTMLTTMTSLTVRTDFASVHEYPVGWEERIHEKMATKVTRHARKFEFCFILMSSSLGFGNMYRFPSLILKYGATFFFTYIIALFACAYPVTLMELSAGQYSGLGPMRSCREAAPAFAGLGLSNVMTSGFCAVYWGVTLAWVLFYMYNSFFTPLPWLTCSNTWNTNDCFSRTDDQRCRTVNRTFFFGACQTFQDFCSSRTIGGHRYAWVPGDDRRCQNMSNLESVPFSVLRINVTLPSNEFFKRGMLQHYFEDGREASLSRLGDLAMPVLVCNAFSWLLTFAFIVLYKNSTNKAFVASCLTGGTFFKSLIIIILFLRAVTLPHARDGLRVFEDPHWATHLGDPNLWYDSVTHTIFCTGVGFGGLFTFASSNDFYHSFVWDSVGLCFTNAAVSTLMSVILYSYVGHLRNTADVAEGGTLTAVTVNRVIKYGFGLIFSTYPEAMDATPVPNLWAILLFAMLTLITLESQCGMVKVILLAIEEESGQLRSPRRKAVLTLAICIVGFLLSIPLCSQGGIYLIILMIDFSAVFPLMVVCLFNVVLFIFVYGRGKLLQHFEEMVKPGSLMKSYLRVTWPFFAPVILVICTAVSLVALGEPADIVFKDSPTTTYIVGWTYALMHVMPIPIFMGVQIFRKRHKTQSIKSAFTPTQKWSKNATLAEMRRQDQRFDQEHRNQPRHFPLQLGPDQGAMTMMQRRMSEREVQADLGSMLSGGTWGFETWSLGADDDMSSATTSSNGEEYPAKNMLLTSVSGTVNPYEDPNNPNVVDIIEPLKEPAPTIEIGGPKKRK